MIFVCFVSIEWDFAGVSVLLRWGVNCDEIEPTRDLLYYVVVWVLLVFGCVHWHY